jgi:hypothetical protein
MKATEEFNHHQHRARRAYQKEHPEDYATRGWVKYTRPGVKKLLDAGHEWEKWYAWRPVRDIHGAWHCFEDVYRLRGNTYVDQDDCAWYYYGTVFDILKND